MKGILRRIGLIGLLIAAPAAWADGDTSADVPGGFADGMNQTKGVVVRVPINERGEENTNAAELRFDRSGVAVTKSSDPIALWDRSANAPRIPEVMGTNAPADQDSSTWGWYGWYGNGWASPFYYTYYYPTFYYNNSYWQYNYYWNWNNYGYRYYYYYYWW